MKNDDELKNSINNIFDDAWKTAPRIGGLNDLGEHIARAIKEISAENIGNYQNLIVGKISIFDENDDQETGKGALELQIITASISPIHDMLENYKPKLGIDEFVAVMTDNNEGQLTLIAFANGCRLTTLTTNNDDEIGVSDYDHTKKMFANAGASTNRLMRIYDRLIEIASQ
jgi:hypothetical protein